MTVSTVVRGWRLGVVVGSGMVRVWVIRWVVTLYDSVGASKAN